MCSQSSYTCFWHMIPSFVNRCWRSIRLKLFTGCTQRCGVCVCASARVGVSVYGAVRIPHDCMTFSRQQFFVYVCVCVCLFVQYTYHFLCQIESRHCPLQSHDCKNCLRNMTSTEMGIFSLHLLPVLPPPDCCTNASTRARIEINQFVCLRACVRACTTKYSCMNACIYV